MIENKLDITSLKNAIEALRKSIDVYKKNCTEDIDLSESLRSGVIQNFEVAYELSWKFMKRWLEINISPDIILGVTRKEFYRIAAENSLITDVEKWWDFHKVRNRTSHTYDGIVAEDILKTAFEFLPHAKDFVSRMERPV
ncbi:MAG: nucleotidyltransferase substrate binding protein [Holosporaceae bacterium]|jgi:nucleotidyltransferase substrate binding protein (TIGR01987 family)|nr:nucleotidyltransferase substrate binding protein [Holosporaceae bacterium]